MTRLEKVPNIEKNLLPEGHYLLPISYEPGPWNEKESLGQLRSCFVTMKDANGREAHTDPWFVDGFGEERVEVDRTPGFRILFAKTFAEPITCENVERWAKKHHYRFGEIREGIMFAKEIFPSRDDLPSLLTVGTRLSPHDGFPVIERSQGRGLTLRYEELDFALYIDPYGSVPGPNDWAEKAFPPGTPFLLVATELWTPASLS